ncbi:MAG: glycosyltransferase family 4 protein [Chthonomonadales bacterium]
MGRIVSLILDDFNLLEFNFSGKTLHGANVATEGIIGRLARDERIEALEIFLDPGHIIQQDRIREIAISLLPPERQGKDILRFYPLHSLPEVWANGLPRILFCLDPERMARERYLRDRYAIGPTPIACDTHAMAHYQMSHFLDRYSRATPVAFDSMINISRACMEGNKKLLAGILTPVGTPLPCRQDLIYRGVDIEEFQPATPERKAEARRLLKLPENGCIALYLGRMTPKSKADLMPLLRVFDQIETENEYLVLAGAEGMPGYIDELNALGKELGIHDRLIIHSEVPTDARSVYYAAADFFVFPGDTLQEALGNTVLEAMASGLATIVSHWDGMRELVADGVTGFLIPTWMMPISDRVSAFSPFTHWNNEYLLTAQSVYVDPKHLAEKMSLLYQSVDLRTQMGAAARLAVDGKYASNKIIDQYHVLWDELEEMARKETEQEASIRRAGAMSLAFPTPYNYLISHYPTNVIDPKTVKVQLTEYGLAVVRGNSQLTFYDETLPLIYPAVINRIYEFLTSIRNVATVAEISNAVVKLTLVEEDDIRYHVALLLKRSVLQIV